MREGTRDPQVRQGGGRNRAQMLPRDGPHKCPSGRGEEEGSGTCGVWRGRERSKGGIYEDRIYRKLFQLLPCATGSEYSLSIDARQHFTFKRQEVKLSGIMMSLQLQFETALYRVLQGDLNSDPHQVSVDLPWTLHQHPLSIYCGLPCWALQKDNSGLQR